jgi:hypothetical protein
MQTYAGRQMDTFGYERDSIHFSPTKWARYVMINHPANLARMLFWLARESLQQQFPGAARRRPSRAMLLPSGTGDAGIQGKS